MSDYILEMKMEMLREHPMNSTIYSTNEKELEDLRDSIDKNGLLEPITITPNNTIISGHRRYQAIKKLGWETIDCRLSNFENTLIAIVELNRYRKKTGSELLRESEVLNEEYKKMTKMGRPRKGEIRTKDNSTLSLTKVADGLGTSTTKLKKLMSIRKYEPSMLDRIDKGIISVHHAYQLVMEEHVWKGTKRKKTFEYELSQLFNKYKINDPETAYRKMMNTMENLGWSFPKN